jgi:DNA modification methylase
VSYEILQGDCIEHMGEMEEASVDAVVCDPPYGLEFMGKEWDRLGGGERKSSKPGIGDRPTGWVSNRGWNTMRCRTCGHLGHGGSPCSCDKPDFAAADDRMQKMQGWHHAWATEALRVLRPGGHLLAFGGTRTYHRLACAIEDAGFEIRDSILNVNGGGDAAESSGLLAWIYGSG